METQQENIKETDEFKELDKVIQEIQNEKDESEIAYEDIRFLTSTITKCSSIENKKNF